MSMEASAALIVVWVFMQVLFTYASILSYYKAGYMDDYPLMCVLAGVCISFFWPLLLFIGLVNEVINMTKRMGRSE